MANFVKAGRPVKGGKKRNKRFDGRMSDDEMKMMDELVQVLHKRRNVGLSRMDMLVYLMEKEYTHQDMIRVISSTSSESNV